MTQSTQTAGTLIREWRTRRRLSQLDLAAEADISQRHLSFLESGRSAPSRDMVLHLAEHLDIPLRQRNELLMAAGFAPSFAERPLGDPSMAAAHLRHRRSSCFPGRSTRFTRGIAAWPTRPRS